MAHHQGWPWRPPEFTNNTAAFTASLDAIVFVVTEALERVFCGALTVATVLLSWLSSDSNIPENALRGKTLSLLWLGVSVFKWRKDYTQIKDHTSFVTINSQVSYLSTKTHTCMFIWEDQSKSVHLGFGKFFWITNCEERVNKSEWGGTSSL